MPKKLNCILLIDDDEATNFLSNLILEEVAAAHHVKTKQTARAALNYIADSAHLEGKMNTLPYPDLIFFDLNMPAMDGWEFLQRYEALPEAQKSSIIVVMLTTSFNPEDELKARKIDAVKEFRNKPLTSVLLRDILKKYFPDR